jgi:hypothetical protein
MVQRLTASDGFPGPEQRPALPERTYQFQRADTSLDAMGVLAPQQGAENRAVSRLMEIRATPVQRFGLDDHKDVWHYVKGDDKTRRRTRRTRRSSPRTWPAMPKPKLLGQN